MNNVLKYIFQKLEHSEVNIITDRYYEYSAKTSTRTSRVVQQASRRHKLTPSTALPAQSTALTLTENKQQIISTICKQLQEKGKTHKATAKHRLLIILLDPLQYQWKSLRGYHREKNLKTTHKEADVIIPRQLVDAATQGSKCIKVICNDTDVFILLIHYYQKCSLTCTLLMESTSTGATAKQHADITCQLLAAHALTGCDTVGFMWGIGQAKAVIVLSSGYKLLKIDNPDMAMDEVLQEATHFAARCYGYVSSENMSSTRL